MKNIEYEWVVEEKGVGFIEAFNKCPSLKNYPPQNYDIALVLDDWNYTTEGRYWAYVRDGMMTDVFLNAFDYEHDYRKVPQRFIKEFNKENKLWMNKAK